MSVRSVRAFAVLLLAALLVRLPYFFIDVIDWDESTFIVMGQSLLDGQLPYLVLWDNKPPLCFASFAAFLAVFGKSIVGIRIAGMLCVTAAAALIYRIGAALWDHRTGLAAGLACVLLVSFASRGQATMSETVAIVPLSAALVPLILATGGRGRWLAAGLLLSVAFMIRTNLVVVAATVGASLVLELVREPSRARRLALGLYTLGTAVPVALTAVPYAATGHLGLWFDSVFVVPFVYAVVGVSGLFALAPRPFDVLADRGLFALAAALMPNPGRRWRDAWRQLDAEKRRAYGWLGAVFVAVMISILVSGGGSAHYWIQLHPLTALVAGRLVVLVWDRGAPVQRWRVHIATMALLLAASMVLGATLLRSYGAMIRNFDGGRPVVHGRAVRLADYLAAHNPAREPVFLLADHLAYWFLGAKPLSRASTHPSVLFREPLLRAFLGPEASSRGEMQHILELAPLYIVKTKTVRYQDRAPEAAQVLADELARHYQLETTLDGLLLYRRAGR